MKKSVLIIWALLFCACQKELAPRPYGYFRVDLPTNEYVALDTLAVYAFDISKHAQVQQNPRSKAYCIDIYYPQIDGTIYCTYEEFRAADFRKVSEESRELAYKHVVRAESITERVFANDEARVYGILYDFKGNTASSVQFFLTDSVRRYFRGSLYFNARPNNDSIAPMRDFVREDIIRLVETFKWK